MTTKSVESKGKAAVRRKPSKNDTAPTARDNVANEPDCWYTIISEASDSCGNATTWAKGEDGG
jgi:hypothetical protein